MQALTVDLWDLFGSITGTTLGVTGCDLVILGFRKRPMVPLNVASQMSKAMQDIQRCQCDLSIVQKQFVSVIAQGIDIPDISVTLCCYKKSVRAHDVWQQ